jgi:adenine-specific DNA-methyltransferase
MTAEEIQFGQILPDWKLLSVQNLTSQSGGENSRFPVVFGGKTFVPKKNFWKTNPSGMNNLVCANRLIISGNNLNYIRYIDDFPAIPIINLWLDTGTAGFSGEEKLYVVQTNKKVIERCLLMSTDPGDLVLDPTCGSGTTAYVAEQWGRRWITCDTSRVALALARTRLMSARYPYYLLADSPEGVQKEAEVTGKLPPDYKTEYDIRKGFVYKRVPHITLKSIANNPDIKEGMTREEIDKAIAKHTETETLLTSLMKTINASVSQDHLRLRVSLRTGS